MFLSFGSREGISSHGYHVLRGLILTTACFLLSYGEKNLVRVEFGKMTECSEEGLFGNELDCTAFYQCTVDGQNLGSSPIFKKYDFQCPPGTVFDTKIKNCNHPSDSTPVPNCDGNENGNGTQITSTTTIRPRPQAQSKISIRFYSEATKRCLIDAKIAGNQLTTSEQCKQKNALWIPLDWKTRDLRTVEGRFKNKETGKCWFIEAIDMPVTLVECGNEMPKNSFVVFLRVLYWKDNADVVKLIMNTNAHCCLELSLDDFTVKCKKCANPREFQFKRNQLWKNEGLSNTLRI